jgi:hypothetical protein
VRSCIDDFVGLFFSFGEGSTVSTPDACTFTGDFDCFFFFFGGYVVFALIGAVPLYNDKVESDCSNS